MGITRALLDQVSSGLWFALINFSNSEGHRLLSIDFHVVAYLCTTCFLFSFFTASQSLYPFSFCVRINLIFDFSITSWSNSTYGALSVPGILIFHELYPQFQLVFAELLGFSRDQAL